MLLFVIVTHHRLSHVGIVGIVVRRSIVELVAVVVVQHICIDICMIVIHVDGSRTPVVRRIVSPIPGRSPAMIAGPDHMRKYDGPCVINGLDDVVCTIDVRSTDNLNIIIRAGGNFGNDGRYVLIDVECKYGLYHEDVCEAVFLLENAEIINITVAVEVEVRDHIGRVVEEDLELFDCAGLGERCSNGLEVEVKRDVIIRSHGAGGGGHGTCPGNRNGSAVGVDCLGIGRHRNDTGGTATGKDHRQYCQSA